MEKEPLTLLGLEKLKKELIFLKEKKRPEIVAAIAEARSHGDLKENAEYHAAKEKQGFIEGRIQELENIISRADIIDVSKLSGNIIKFGATVTLADEDTDEELTYQIVGPYEANLENNSTAESSINFLQALLFAFIGGLILNLMPCVFPIISFKDL